MIKLVALDWNGTILSDVKAVVRCENLVLKHYGLKLITVEDYQNYFEIPIRKFWKNLKLDLNFFDQNSKKIHDLFFKHYGPIVENQSRTRVGARNLLAWLQANKINAVVFSNHHIPGIKKQLKRLGLTRQIDQIVARAGLYDHAHMHARHKEAKLSELVKNFKVRPSEVMVVGDTDEEIEIGKKLGYITVALTGGHHSVKRLKASKPDYLIHNLSELKKIIQAL